MSKMDEMVAVFPASILVNYTRSGYYKFHSRLLATVLKNICFQRRGDMENDESWRQLIPYIYLYNREGAMLTYRRTPASGEGRLHAKVSVGFGGHITKEDATDDPSQLLHSAGMRELFEELSFNTSIVGQLVPAGFIIGHETPVDRVHFGVAMALQYKGTIKANDAECELLGWKKRAELLREPNLESWSIRLLQESGK